MLTGGVPPLAPPAQLLGLKEKRKIKAGQLNHKWEWKPFTSSARSDGLALYHWCRDDYEEKYGKDHWFSRYNRFINAVQYSDEEYDKVVSTLDESWSRDDTDHLMDLCHRFDLRFHVVLDRWEKSGNPSLEDLKERYYAIAAALTRYRARNSLEASEHPAVKELYNARHERARRAALASALKRTRKQEREEEEILAEARRIREQRKQEAERKALLAEDKGAVSSADIPSLDLHSLPRQPRGPWLRSTLARRMAAEMAPNLGNRISKRLEQMMVDLGVGKSPGVATDLVCNCYLALRQEMLKLLDVQKRLARKEQELAKLKEAGLAAEKPGAGGASQAAVAVGNGSSAGASAHKIPLPTDALAGKAGAMHSPPGGLGAGIGAAGPGSGAAGSVGGPGGSHPEHPGAAGLPSFQDQMSPRAARARHLILGDTTGKTSGQGAAGAGAGSATPAMAMATNVAGEAAVGVTAATATATAALADPLGLPDVQTTPRAALGEGAAAAAQEELSANDLVATKMYKRKTPPFHSGKRMKRKA